MSPQANNNGWATPLTEAEKIEADREMFVARIEELEEALKPFADNWIECQPYADFGGADRRESYLAGGISLAEFEAAHNALKASTNHERDGV
jgi:hypothetical protein